MSDSKGVKILETGLQADIAAAADLCPFCGIREGDHQLICPKDKPVAADIAEGREVLAKMSPGEWKVQWSPIDDSGISCGYVRMSNGTAFHVHTCDHSTIEKNGADARGIAYLRNKASGWLDELARLRAAVPGEVPTNAPTLSVCAVQGDGENIKIGVLEVPTEVREACRREAARVPERDYHDQWLQDRMKLWRYIASIAEGGK